MADIDSDGRKDLLCGDTRGQVWIFMNEGSKGRPELASGKLLEIEGRPMVGSSRRVKVVNGKSEIETVAGHPEEAEQYTKIHLADWNLDGFPDLLVGHTEAVLLLYLNKGEKGKLAFSRPVKIKPEGGTLPIRPSPFLFDWDGDGKRDLLVGCDAGQVWLFANTGEDGAPKFGRGRRLEAGGKPIQTGHRARIDVADWNNDGVPDLLVGDFYSVPAEKSGERGKMGGHVWLFKGVKAEEDF